MKRNLGNLLFQQKVINTKPKNFLLSLTVPHLISFAHKPVISCAERNFVRAMLVHQPQWTVSSSLSRSHDQTQTHYIRQDSSGRVIGPTHRTLPDKPQHSQKKIIQTHGGIRARFPVMQTTADPELRMKGFWDRHWLLLKNTNNVFH